MGSARRAGGLEFEHDAVSHQAAEPPVEHPAVALVPTMLHDLEELCVGDEV